MSDILVPGTPEPDTINGSEADEDIYGMAGDDWLAGLGGNDILRGQAGSDRLFGGSGKDLLFGGAGDDLLFGGMGDDTLRGGAGNDTLWGSDGSYASRNAVFGEDGDDLFHVSALGQGRVDGGSGTDTLRLWWREAAGTVGDAWVAISGADVGARTTSTLFGDIRLNIVGIERLEVVLGDGNDTVIGGDLGDEITVGEGSNTVMAMGGDDRIAVVIDTVIRDRVQTIDGGEGFDTLRLVNRTPNFEFTAGPGGATDSNGSTYANIERYEFIGSHYNDRATLGSGNDRFEGFFGNDIARGMGGNDSMLGGAANDTLYGGNGRDTLVGSNGSDQLFGDAGNDVLVGGLGSDTLTGGAGADNFRFAANDDAADLVADMVSGQDRIGIAAGRIGWALAAGALDPARFATGAASGGEGQFVYVFDAGANEGRLFWDADGEGPGGATLIARFAGDPGIGAADIYIF